MSFAIVRADARSVGGAVPLLLQQMREHRIVGRALYDGSLTLERAIDAARAG